MILGQATQESTNRPHIPCIYKIENKKTGAVYIGSTKDFSNRYRQHKNKLVNGKHNSRAMQRDFNKGDPLDMTVIEDCTGLSAAELLQHEQAQIVKYGSLENGYNTAVAWCGDLPQALCMSHADSSPELDALRQELDDVTADRDAIRAELDRVTAERDQLRQRLDDQSTGHAAQLERIQTAAADERRELTAGHRQELDELRREYQLQLETTKRLENALFKMLETANNATLERIKQSRQPQRKPTLWERVFRKGA